MKLCGDKCICIIHTGFIPQNPQTEGKEAIKTDFAKSNEDMQEIERNSAGERRPVRDCAANRKGDIS